MADTTDADSPLPGLATPPNTMSKPNSGVKHESGADLDSRPGSKPHIGRRQRSKPSLHQTSTEKVDSLALLAVQGSSAKLNNRNTKELDEEQLDSIQTAIDLSRYSQDSVAVDDPKGLPLCDAQISAGSGTGEQTDAQSSNAATITTENATTAAADPRNAAEGNKEQPQPCHLFSATATNELLRMSVGSIPPDLHNPLSPISIKIAKEGFQVYKMFDKDLEKNVAKDEITIDPSKPGAVENLDRKQLSQAHSQSRKPVHFALGQVLQIKTSQEKINIQQQQQRDESDSGQEEAQGRDRLIKVKIRSSTAVIAGTSDSDVTRSMGQAATSASDQRRDDAQSSDVGTSTGVQQLRARHDIANYDVTSQELTTSDDVSGSKDVVVQYGTVPVYMDEIEDSYLAVEQLHTEPEVGVDDATAALL